MAEPRLISFSTDTGFEERMMLETIEGYNSVVAVNEDGRNIYFSLTDGNINNIGVCEPDDDDTKCNYIEDFDDAPDNISTYFDQVEETSERAIENAAANVCDMIAGGSVSSYQLSGSYVELKFSNVSRTVSAGVRFAKGDDAHRTFNYTGPCNEAGDYCGITVEGRNVWYFRLFSGGLPASAALDKVYKCVDDYRNLRSALEFQELFRSEVAPLVADLADKAIKVAFLMIGIRMD